MGFVDRGTAGWTELRVHGVSGTPPESMLQHPWVHRVAGDDAAGFYRREWENPIVSADRERRIEAYSWGGLTSGSWQRALWLLLLPFMLVNIAYYMTARSPLNESRTWRVVRRTSEAAQRALALSLTATLVLATVAASMDVVGWQCTREGMACQASWIGVLQWPWLRDPGRQLTVTALVPLVVVALLWRLGRNTWAVGEASAVPVAQTDATQDHRTPLEDRRFWNGRAPVARLRALHVAAGFALVGLFLPIPFLSAPDDGVRPLFSGEQWSNLTEGFSATLAFALIVVLLICLLAMVSPSLSERARPRPGKPDDATWQPWVNWVSLALTAAAVVLAWTNQTRTDGLSRQRPATNLPWLVGATQITFALQVVLMIVLLVVGIAQAFSSRSEKPIVEVPTGSGGSPVSAARAWFGMGTVIFAALGWLLSGALASALTLRAADLLGTPVSEVGPEATPIVLPVQYFWAAAAALVVLVGAALIAVVAWRQLSGHRGRVLETMVSPAYPRAGLGAAHRDDVQARAESITRTWTTATVPEVARRPIGVLIMFSVLVTIVGLTGFIAKPDWPINDAPRAIVTAGSLVLLGGVLGLLYVGRKAYSSARMRRSIGIVWDVGTFWPRATHPLAPPCYAERTVPDLVRRIEYLADNESGKVLLSCHSQGTVIGAALVAQLRTDSSRQIAFLTYGCPLRRLYARFFPSYFGLDPLLRLGELLRGAPGCEPTHRQVWPWINLHRPSDPIGGAVFVEYPACEARRGEVAAVDWRDQAGTDDDLAERARLRRERHTPGTFENGDVDWQIIDPRFDRPAGDGCYPLTHGHSDYWEDPAFNVASRLLRERRARAVRQTQSSG
jgi:hypothetical protein